MEVINEESLISVSNDVFSSLFSLQSLSLDKNTEHKKHILNIDENCLTFSKKLNFSFQNKHGIISVYCKQKFMYEVVTLSLEEDVKPFYPLLDKNDLLSNLVGCIFYSLYNNIKSKEDIISYDFDNLKHTDINDLLKQNTILGYYQEKDTDNILDDIVVYVGISIND